MLFLGRRHLAPRDTVVEPGPFPAVGEVVWRKSQIEQVQLALGLGVVVADSAMLVEEGGDGAGVKGRSQSRCGRGSDRLLDENVGDAHLFQAALLVDHAFNLIDQLVPREPPHDLPSGIDLGEEVASLVCVLQVIIAAGDEQISIRQTRHA